MKGDPRSCALQGVDPAATSYEPRDPASSPRPGSDGRSRLLALQALRAIAALSVVVLHGSHEGGLVAGTGGLTFAIPRLVPWEAGVDIFFVVSGFVMVYASGRLFVRRGGAALFLARRLARIVPLYWTATTLFLVLALSAPNLLAAADLSRRYVLASYLFVPFPRADGEVVPLYSLGWTLDYEMLFYVLFAAAIRFRRTTAVAVVALVLGAGVALGRLVPLPQPFAFWADPIVVEFILGMALGLVRSRGTVLNAAPRWALAGFGLVGFATAAAWRTDVGGLARPLLFGGPSACLVAAACLGRPRAAAARAPFAELVAARLGDASYALYLLHPFVFRGCRIAWRFAGLPTGGAAVGVFVLVGIAGSILAALAVFLILERPVTATMRRRLEWLLAGRAGADRA